MQYPYLNDIERYREMTTAFNGYCHKLTCEDGQFYDQKNMTSVYYPVLSPRDRRGIVRKMIAPAGILDKESLVWIDDGILYLDGEECVLADGITISKDADKCPKQMEKMGAFIIIMPDKIWYNAETKESGYMEATFDVTDKVTVTLADGKGNAITWHDTAYYDSNEPADGDYMMSTQNGSTTLKQYSKSTAIWAIVATTYIQIGATGIGKNFAKDDGVKISVDTTGITWDDIENIFVNDDGDNIRSNNMIIYDIKDDCITVPAILKENKTFDSLHIKVERKTPDMSFITECNNRIWGCSKDGHEIYCCKLGDVKNWNCFQGISTDSYAATVGSDGKFTGAVTYQTYPIFFKEDSLIKVYVSASGAHQIKETKCRGVQRGSERSLCIMNEVLYYKSTTDVCSYAGSIPVSISESLGQVRYHDAVGGTINSRYFLSMKDKDNMSHLFVFDAKRNLWSKEDNTTVLYFCAHDDDLYFVDASDSIMKSVYGTLPYDVPEKDIEKRFKWMAESGNIGYSMPDNKYISRVNVRIGMEVGTNVDFYIQYDSSDVWEHKFNMSGKGTRTYTVPVIPRRCDHFKYKIVGEGTAKIYSVTKTIEQGSDI